MNDPLWKWSAENIAGAVKAGVISATEAVTASVERMREVNPAVNAVVVDLGDEAIRTAEKADEERHGSNGQRRLEGVPVTIKVNIDYAGKANTNGLEGLKNLVASRNAPIVQNLLGAGAIPVGLTNTPEFSMRAMTDNPLYGLTLNPWDNEVTCGGSSGGAAASLALGIGAIAHGNDIGGSLRWPAHCCGVTTIRPTQGRVPAFNETASAERPVVSQLFATQGPMARSVADLRIGLEVMSARDPNDPWWVPAPLFSEKPTDPIRVAVAKIPDFLDADPRIMQIVADASNHLHNEGYEIEEIELPGLSEIWQGWADLLFEEIRTIQSETIRSMASTDFKRIFNCYNNLSNILDKKGYMEALAQRTYHLRTWMSLLEDYPVILTPAGLCQSYGARADLEGQDAVDHIFRHGLFFISPLNYLGLPAVVVPAGMVDKKPVGVQLISTRFREDIALDAAEAIERRVGRLCPNLWARNGGQ